MKKITVSLMFMLFTLAASAQHFDIRGYGGYNMMQLTSDQGSSLIDNILHNRTVSGRPGYQFGVAVTYGDRFYVQPGFEWVTSSTKVVNKNNVTGAELTDETTLSMFSIPLKVGVRLIDPNTENIFNVRVFGGFDGAHVTKVNHSLDHPSTGDLDEDDYSNLIMSADFGMGIDIAFLFIDAGYKLGLSPFHAGGDNAKGNSFYANLGLRIGL